MENNKLLDFELLHYIQSKKWGNFDNKEMDLLVRSMQARGFRQAQKRAPRKMKAEDIVLDYADGRQLKAYALAASFSPDIIQTYLEDIRLMEDCLQRSCFSLNRAKEKITEIKRAIDVESEIGLVEATKKLLDDFFEISYWKYYLTTLARKMHETDRQDKELAGILARVEAWRNDKNFYNFEGEILIEISHFLSLKRGLGVHGWEICKYLHIDEFLEFLHAKSGKEELRETIERRKKIGYIFLNLDHPDHESRVLCGSLAETQEIKNHIDSVFEKGIRRSQDEKILHGVSVQKANGLVQGECVVIKNHQELEGKKLEGKILVTTMSTPRYLPYIKKVKAIITDSGGIMSHAAIMARELGIPCISGANVATTFFETGDRVEIDLKKGIIKKK